MHVTYKYFEGCHGEWGGGCTIKSVPFKSVTSEDSTLSRSLAEPLWTDRGLKNGITARELISTAKKEKEKKRRQGMNSRTFFPNPRMRGKSQHQKKKKTVSRVRYACTQASHLGRWLHVENRDSTWNAHI